MLGKDSEHDMVSLNMLQRLDSEADAASFLYPPDVLQDPIIALK